MRVVITKKDGTLRLYDGDNLVRTVPVVLGRNPADKEREGDLATPVGEFYVCYRNPNSRYHRFLGISYPNLEDAERGRQASLINETEYEQIRTAIAAGTCPPWKTGLGGEVGLHGPSPNVTWTHGCIAMDRDQIEQLYDLLQLGDEVVIRP